MSLKHDCSNLSNRLPVLARPQSLEKDCKCERTLILGWIKRDFTSIHLIYKVYGLFASIDELEHPARCVLYFVFSKWWYANHICMGYIHLMIYLHFECNLRIHHFNVIYVKLLKKFCWILCHQKQLKICLFMCDRHVKKSYI